MFSLNENYYLRKSYLKRNEVPTQTMIKKKMGSELAKVLFKSMSAAAKVQAGLEPPLKGGGSEWVMPPQEILGGRFVLKPIKEEYLQKLSHQGILNIGTKLSKRHKANLAEEKRATLSKNTEDWKHNIHLYNDIYYSTLTKIEAKNISDTILKSQHEFEHLYRISLTKIQILLQEAAEIEIMKVKEDIYQHMKEVLKQKIRFQAKSMHDEYQSKLDKAQTEKRLNFISSIEKLQTGVANQLHDVNLEKHMAIEKLRHFLKSQTLATQMYAVLKEKEHCEDEIKQMSHEHKIQVKHLQEEIDFKDYDISLEQEHQYKCNELNQIWRKKVCLLVKKFQLFMQYCLRNMPKHADFFLNLEKLMIWQLNEICEKPKSTLSIFESESKTPPGPNTPIAKPHPFYLLCDKTYKAKVDEKLCPKHCTSSASQFPVIILDKRCIYTVCDTMGTFNDKVSEFLLSPGCDDDFNDDKKCV